MSIYEEVELEDLDFDPIKQLYTYPCPCGDKFRIKLEDMWEFGEDIATCPSCTLRIRIIYDEDDLPELCQDDSGDDDSAVDGLETNLGNMKVVKNETHQKDAVNVVQQAIQ